MSIALSKDQLDFIFEKVVKPLVKKDCEVYVFGSRARNSNNQYSDLDILIKRKNQSSDKVRRLIGNISEELENSNFPYKVDLVLEDDIAESYLDNIRNDLIPLNP